MVKVIMGPKGTGKTKKMIEMVNSAAKTEEGNVICIERGRKLTYDIDYSIRLVDADHYELNNMQIFKGFISGLYAGNYDISHVFVDSLYKIVPEHDESDVVIFLAWLDKFSADNTIDFTIMISSDATEIADGIKKFF